MNACYTYHIIYLYRYLNGARERRRSTYQRGSIVSRGDWDGGEKQKIYQRWENIIYI